MHYIGDLTDTSIPDINLGGTLYSLDQLLDKSLLATTTIQTYFIPKESATNKAYAINANETIGQIYGWVGGFDTSGNLDGSIWLMFYPKNGDATTAIQINDPKSFYYWKVKNGTGVSAQALNQQGALSVPQQVAEAAAKKANESMDIFDKIGVLLKTYGPWLIGGAVVLTAAKFIPLPKRNN